ncbi:reductase [Listeria weihenstephanensis FSL R9-0317]|uniref:Dihydrofolate reductase n=1 Tax=Listeria weihenstephanensis TaxID=1006155 RepID=A0A1S7FU67_9LIST|nr:dihydrofolate reductase family protein [Listeria weihenstephanensis]AQY50919.1 dihydrofolate reductase [Listeria weihenstephanensis]EUJ39945.1 reductase [Listeria weihenstephanensis FSL R9-0317]MBC1499857.1 dihydrofolate reductase [Listeria weihenstephanensis]
MRKVVFYGAITLDGYLSDDTNSLTWLFETDTGGETTYEKFIQNIDTVIMGRVTYEEVLKIQGNEPLYADQDVFVFSRDTSTNFQDVQTIHQDPVSFVNQLKEKEGKTIWIVGGGNLLKPLLEANMIDEWWIQITPVMLGKGKRLFEEGDYAERLELVDTTTFGQFVELHYKKISD